MSVGDVLRRFREGKGITQKELADVLGVSASNVGQIEGGYIAMRSDLIGKMKDHFPEAWKALVAARLAEERAALRVDDSSKELDTLSADVLREAAEYLLQAAKQQESGKPPKRKRSSTSR